MNIGVFDSGVGGLSIFREILNQLPLYDYIYFGDNARVPYGGRSKDLIYSFTKNAVNFLFQKDCQLIILACNAATSNALRRLQQEYLPANYPNRRILGVIFPTVETAIANNSKRFGIMATRATVTSDSYPIEIKKLFPQAIVFQHACPLLVPIIEEDEIEWKGLDLLIKKYLSILLKNNIDTLILGCTHYGLITEKIRRYLPKHIKLITQGKATATKLKDYLKRHPEIESKLTKNATLNYYVTDLNQRYEKLMKLFLGDCFDKTSKLHLINL